MNLFGKEFLEIFIAKTNLSEGKFFRKVTLEVALGWKPISHEDPLVFFGQTIIMRLIVKRSMKIV